MQSSTEGDLVDEWGNSTKQSEAFKSNILINWLQFTYGLYTAGIAKTSDNAMICQQSAVQLYNSSIDFYGQITNLTREGVEETLTSWETILGTAYPLTYSCYTGVGEV